MTPFGSQKAKRIPHPFREARIVKTLALGFTLRQFRMTLHGQYFPNPLSMFHICLLSVTEYI
jgi:hypothetical protein